MRKSKYEFTFPKAESGYWYLIWIGKIHYKRRQKKVMLFFVNKNERNDLVGNFNEKSIYKILVPASYLADFHIGMLYSVEEMEFVSYNLAKSRKFQLYVSRLDVTNDRIPLFDNTYFRFLDDESSVDIECMKYHRSIKDQTIPVFITPYCIAEYLFFRSDKLVNKILSGELLDGFKLREAFFYFDKSSKEKVVELSYNQDLIDIRDASIIVPYLFLRSRIGIKLINGVYSNLHSSLHNSTEKLKKSAYLKCNLSEFSNFRIELEGKYHQYGGEKVYREHQLFLAYRITKLELNKDAFLVDRVDLVPYNSKSSTKDRGNHERINVSRPVTPNTKIHSLSLSQNATNSYSSAFDCQKTNQMHAMPIKINVIRRTEQQNAYDVTSFPLDEIEGISRELENLDSSINIYKEKIEKEFEHIDSISNFVYFKKLIKILIDQYNLNININPFHAEHKERLISIDGFKVDVVEISYGAKYFYLIEFGKGFMGMFNSLNPILPSYLEILISDFLSFSKDLCRGQVLWTLINTRKDFYKGNFQIEIQTGVEHKRQGTNEDIFKGPAEIIYYQRIKKSF